MKAAILTAVLALAMLGGSSATAETAGPVAYVGCSVSELSVGGYHIVGGLRMWPRNSKYDSGYVATWAGLETNRWWLAFNSMNATYPGAQQVWWQLCVQTGTDPARLHADALTVLAKIHAHLPNAQVYVSGLPDFVDHVCANTGLDGIAKGNAERDALVAAGLVELGPQMPSLPYGYVYLGSPCHPNFKGQKREGDALKAFFG